MVSKIHESDPIKDQGFKKRITCFGKIKSPNNVACLLTSAEVSFYLAWKILLCSGSGSCQAADSPQIAASVL